MDAIAEGRKPERGRSILHESLCSIRISLAVLGYLVILTGVSGYKT